MMPRVLIADDEKEIADILAKRISKEGFDVVKAYDGEQAWRIISEENLDIALLDVTMPGLTGLEVLAQLRAHPPSKKYIPVIIISAHGELNDIQKGIQLEADHYLVKPCKSEEIIKTINLMLNLRDIRKN